MWSMFSKWGSIVIVILVFGVLGISLMNSAQGISTWMSDHYLPKKYIIVEKYPFKVIMYGQIKDQDFEKSLADDAFLKLVEMLGMMPAVEGQFKNNDYDINFDSNFNSKQVRSTDRRVPSVKVMAEKVDVE